MLVDELPVVSPWPRRLAGVAALLIVLCAAIWYLRKPGAQTEVREETPEASAVTNVTPKQGAVPVSQAPAGATAAQQPAADTRPAPPVPPVAATPPTPTADEAAKVALGEIDAWVAAGKLLEARDRAVQVLETAGAGTSDEVRAQVEARLGRTNMELLMTPRPMPEKVEWVVQSGDSAGRIAQRYGTTIELLQKSNGISNPALIKVGDRLRVFNGRFTVSVSKSRHDLVLKVNDRFFKRYVVGTGKFGKTPVGTFVIENRVAQPPWWRSDGKAIPFGDKENILGTHWLGLKASGQTPDVKGYGIHGTWDNDSLGKDESSGCIRLRNEEVEELYIILPVGTAVTVQE